MFLPVEKHWVLPKLCPGINVFAAIPFSNSQNASFVPDDSCWISKHLRPSSVTWSDLQHGDTVQMYDGLSDASVLLHTQLLWRPTVRCSGLWQREPPLFPGRWTVQLERGVTVLVLAVVSTDPAFWASAVRQGRQTSDLFCGFQNRASEKLPRLTSRAAKQGRPGWKVCIPGSAFFSRVLRGVSPAVCTRPSVNSHMRKVGGAHVPLRSQASVPQQ